jgi:hypothetical protein
MKSRELVEIAVETAKAGGAFDIRVERGSKHIKVLFTAPKGQKLMVVVASTPSCQNAVNRVGAEVKRALRRAAG